MWRITTLLVSRSAMHFFFFLFELVDCVKRGDPEEERGEARLLINLFKQEDI